MGLARASVRPGRRAQELDARAAQPGGARAPAAPRVGESSAKVGAPCGSLGCLVPWLSEDRVGVGMERSGRSRRSAAGTGLWVWER